jgi:hypothetical protein
MRLLCRRMFVVLIALGFIASGIGRMAFALASEPCHPKSEMTQQHIHHHGQDHASHDHNTHPDNAETGNTTDTTDTCFKCCGICTASPQLSTPSLSADARLVSYGLTYFVLAESWADRPLVIDPGIPKRIV